MTRALSAIYGRVTRLRRSWYERHPSARRRLSRPVISVGNLAAGGSGKTPVVAALARMLLARGERPAVLSRGYARRRVAEGVVVVSEGAGPLVPVEESGDEPQMLARELSGVPILVSRDRYLAGTLAESRFGATVMLLDDGFQHLQLERTVDLLLVAAQDLTDAVLPSGLLREPLSAAHVADAVLVDDTAAEAQRIAAALGVTHAFTVSPRYATLRTLAGEDAPIDGQRIVAAAGIARPQRFFTALRQQGFDVAGELAFGDHHWFTPADVERMTATARSAGAAAIITTAKDATRLEGLLPRLASPLGWRVLPMEVSIEPADDFASWLQARLGQQR